MNSIGAILKEERLRLGMGQDEFATAGGVKRRAQLNYEQDERSPDALYLRRLAAIGVDVQYVLTGQPSTSLLATEEKELLSGFRKLDLRGKVNMLGMLDVVGTPPPEKPKPTPAVTPHPTAQFLGKVKIHQQLTGNVEGDNNFTMPSGKPKKPKKFVAE